MSSYNEQILQSIIDGTPYTNENPYPSRIEVLLMELKEVIESGGGSGGTTNYNLLSNKPTINDVELSANKTSSDLGLQDVISDLETIRSGASAGATAVQPSDMEDALATKVDKVTGKGLSTNDYTDTEKSRVASSTAGVTALEQMNGKRNWINVNVTSQTVSTLDFTVNADNTILVNGSKPSSAVSLTINDAVQLPQGEYVLLDGSGVSSSTLNVTLFRNTSTWTGTTATNGRFEFTANGTDTYYCRIYVNAAVDNVTFKPMIIPKAAYDAGFTDYQPYAPTNRELYEMILALQAGASTNSVQSIASTTELTPRDELF